MNTGDLAHLSAGNIAYLTMVLAGFFAFMLTLASVVLWSNRLPRRSAGPARSVTAAAEARSEPAPAKRAA